MRLRRPREWTTRGYWGQDARRKPFHKGSLGSGWMQGTLPPRAILDSNMKEKHMQLFSEIYSNSGFDLVSFVTHLAWHKNSGKHSMSKSKFTCNSSFPFILLPPLPLASLLLRNICTCLWFAQIGANQEKQKTFHFHADAGIEMVANFSSIVTGLLP